MEMGKKCSIFLLLLPFMLVVGAPQAYAVLPFYDDYNRTPAGPPAGQDSSCPCLTRHWKSTVILGRASADDEVNSSTVIGVTEKGLQAFQ